MERRIVVVGAGISGLAAAHALASGDAVGTLRIEVREATDRVGGKLRTSPFAGRAAVDEGADAFLARVPHAVDLAAHVGLVDDLTSPAVAKAAVWHGRRLHPIPEGLVLGVPAGLARLAGSRLLSWRGKLRAGLEPMLPRRDDDSDAIGTLIRARFGRQVHERLVDALVGSIYAADTDRTSLAMVPQLAAMSSRSRSLLLGARRARAAPVSIGPLFLAPIAGMETLATAVADACRALGVTIRTGTPVTEIVGDRVHWRVDGDPADAVVLATPARHTSTLLTRGAPDTAALLATMDHASVAIVSLAVGGWPQRLRGLSGYLVPKPSQRTVTAASFGSQKWAHWADPASRAGAARTELLRISLGRDGLPVDHLDDDELVRRAVDEVGRHLDVDLQPTDVRVTRWPSAFPQYRPHHLRWLDRVNASLPAGLFACGASYRGVGVPACIADSTATAIRVADLLDAA